MNTLSAQKIAAPIGKLSSLGISEMWQVALLLPSTWDDMTRVVDRFNCKMEVGESYLLKGRLDGSTSTKFGNNKTPRTTGRIVDISGRKIGFTVFGDPREFKLDLKGNEGNLLLFGQIDTFNGDYWLNSPEVVDEKWSGRLRPRYPGKPRVINADTVRDKVVRSLREAIPVAAAFLANELLSYGNREKLAELAGVPGWSLENILTQAHVPRLIENGKKAQLALDYLAALGIIASARTGQDDSVASRPLMLGDWRQRAASISFALTDEQEQAVADSIADLASDTPMRRILSGDVGTGKTAVYGTIAATVVDGFGTAVILLPNESLASQVSREFKEWWPDIPQQLVTGSTSGEVCAPLVIGTTAALFRDTCIPSLIIIDEQQKFSREQREQLVGPETHLLETTATCIPRTQALVRYGIVNVSKLTKCHTPKTIHTKIWQHRQWGEVAAGIKATIAAGDQVLYVYPLREKGEKPEVDDEEPPAGAAKPELKSAAEVFEKWEKIFPGKTRLIHGQMSAADKDSALADMRSGEASVLLATTVIEVGITLPKLRRIVIIHPERFGLTTLHQLRGRVARLGGEGWCDLFLPNSVKDATMERLTVLEQTQDGFQVAEHDMRLRGVGDMSRGSNKQSGADMNFLFGRSVSIDALDGAMKMLEQKP